jgi:DNA invertase Pin-like site-specific DNA recombinase
MCAVLKFQPQHIGANDMAKLIAYYRVSTKRQGDSGLGLEGQRAAVETYARQQGASIVASYTEVESGKRSDRPELAKAIAHAKRSKAVLVVAKLDRLSRNVAFLSAIMESGIEFVACDNPHANRLTLHILAAVAEAEAKAISERTKAALAAAKARGVVFGSARPDYWTTERRESWIAGLHQARQRSIVTRQAKARAVYADLLPAIQEQRKAGQTLQAIADRLNTDGHTTSRGCQWSPQQVRQVLQRCG